MLNRFAPVTQPFFPLSRIARSLQQPFDGLVAHEEESAAGGGANERGADAGVDAAETAGLVEAGGGLEAGFEGVDGMEGEVDCCPC